MAAQPPPRVLEPAASNVADVTAFDPSGSLILRRIKSPLLFNIVITFLICRPKPRLRLSLGLGLSLSPTLTLTLTPNPYQVCYTPPSL